MSRIDRSVTNTSVIPTFESSLFTDRSDSRYAVGQIAQHDVPIIGHQEEVKAYYELRRRVYLGQTGMLSPDEIGEDGTDRDLDDSRSIAFGVYENMGEVDVARCVGALRFIIKGSQRDGRFIEGDAPLPIETLWPEIFTSPEPPRSVEVSRLIARHERAAHQTIIRKFLYKIGVSHIIGQRLGPTYGIVERWFANSMQDDAPSKVIGDRKWVSKYNDWNIPITVDTDLMASRFTESDPGSIEKIRSLGGRMHYFGSISRNDMASPR